MRLIQAIGLAFDLRKLVIAALGLLLLQAGWSGLEWLFSGSASVTPNTFDSGGPAGRLVATNHTRRDLGTTRRRTLLDFGADPRFNHPFIRDARTGQRLDQECCTRF